MNEELPIHQPETPHPEEHAPTAPPAEAVAAQPPVEAVAAQHPVEAVAAQHPVEVVAARPTEEPAKPSAPAENAPDHDDTEPEDSHEDESVEDETHEVKTSLDAVAAHEMVSTADGETAHEAESAPAAVAVAEKPRKNWYVVKVQSGREDTIREAIERRVRKDGLEEFFGQIVIPVEKISEVKTDKKGKKVTKTKERKLYAGYLFVEVEYNDRILYLFRETSGVGDFVGSHPGKPERSPTPMTEREIQRMLGPTSGPEEKESDVPPPPKGLAVGNRVRVVDGPFNGMDAVVRQIQESSGKVQVELSIFGRPVNVDFEYYQVEQE